ncbi:MAG: aerial mycelium formation protein [Euzebyales bacterium]|nr:aerial mycelium formation protein [Euzebyales bacterium]
MEDAHRRRRIDRITAEDYLEGLTELGVAEVRALRDECREEEARLSFARRLAQGQLDIVRAERQRRHGHGEEGLVGALTRILADEPGPRPRGDAHTTPVYAPDQDGYGNRAHDTSVEDPALSRVPDLDDAELEALEQRLADSEAELSELRRKVLDRFDALQDERIRRYRGGEVDIDEVVASTVNPEGAGGH